MDRKTNLLEAVYLRRPEKVSGREKDEEMVYTGRVWPGDWGCSPRGRPFGHLRGG